jgi:hypothetical protein
MDTRTIAQRLEEADIGLRIELRTRHYGKIRIGHGGGSAVLTLRD